MWKKELLDTPYTKLSDGMWFNPNPKHSCCQHKAIQQAAQSLKPPKSSQEFNNINILSIYHPSSIIHHQHLSSGQYPFLHLSKPLPLPPRRCEGIALGETQKVATTNNFTLSLGGSAICVPPDPLKPPPQKKNVYIYIYKENWWNCLRIMELWQHF